MVAFSCGVTEPTLQGVMNQLEFLLQLAQLHRGKPQPSATKLQSSILFTARQELFRRPVLERSHASIPDITGRLDVRKMTNSGNVIAGTGAFELNGELISTWSVGVSGTSGSNLHPDTVYFRASSVDSAYGNSSTAQPSSLRMLPCIRA